MGTEFPAPVVVSSYLDLDARSHSGSAAQPAVVAHTLKTTAPSRLTSSRKATRFITAESPSMAK